MSPFAVIFTTFTKTMGMKVLPHIDAYVVTQFIACPDASPTMSLGTWSLFNPGISIAIDEVGPSPENRQGSVLRTWAPTGHLISIHVGAVSKILVRHRAKV